MQADRTKLKRRARAAAGRLREAYPHSVCGLGFESAHQLLVATILSAQCTDARVNQVTPELFRKYPGPEHFAGARPEELAEDIRSCGYHNQKSKSIIGSSRAIVEEHGGMVPDSLERLVALPGVGRKTASCVLGTWHGIPALVVDTHMVRILNLLGLVATRDPVKIEREMMELLPEEEWVGFTHRVIDHGRAVCVARRPRCGDCVLVALCPSAR